MSGETTRTLGSLASLRAWAVVSVALKPLTAAEYWRWISMPCCPAISACFFSRWAR